MANGISLSRGIPRSPTFDQGCNIRYFNDRGLDCANVALAASRAGLVLLTLGPGIWLLARARGAM